MRVREFVHAFFSPRTFEDAEWSDVDEDWIIPSCPVCGREMVMMALSTAFGGGISPNVSQFHCPEHPNIIWRYDR